LLVSLLHVDFCQSFHTLPYTSHEKILFSKVINFLKKCLENKKLCILTRIIYEIFLLQVIELEAVQQVKTMLSLVDKIVVTAIKTQVAGEVLQTKAPLGVAIIMAK